jgi:hypothetical protein
MEKLFIDTDANEVGGVSELGLRIKEPLGVLTRGDVPHGTFGRDANCVLV